MIDNPKIYEKAKKIADETYNKPSAYKSGFIVKKYKELGGTYTNDRKPKNLKRWFQEDWEDIGGLNYPVYRPTIKVSSKTPLIPSEIKNLSKQIKLKQIIKGNHNLPPFEKKKSINNNIMPRHHEGTGAKDFFKKVGNFLKPVAKVIAKPAIEALKPIATGAITAFQPELAVPGAIAVNSLGNMAEKAIQGWGLKLTLQQARRLRSGGDITITRSALLPNRPTHSMTLHPERLQRLAELVQANHPRVNLQLHEGEGLWDWTKKTAKAIGKALAPKAIDYGKKAFNDYTNNEYSGLVDLAGNEVNKGIQGMGIKSHRQRRRRVGGGTPLVKISQSGIVMGEPGGIGDYVRVRYGGAINTHGGLNSVGNFVQYPIQLGSPYAKIDSQTMNPFFVNHNQYAQYTPIHRLGSGINPPGGSGGGGINPPGGGSGHGGSIVPAGMHYRM